MDFSGYSIILLMLQDGTQSVECCVLVMDIGHVWGDINCFGRPITFSNLSQSIMSSFSMSICFRMLLTFVGFSSFHSDV